MVNSVALSRDQTLTYVDCLMKKPKPLLLYHGSRKSSVKHAQLRMKCSKLNFDLFSLHVIDSPACPCGHIREDSNHYLLQCPLYFQARNKMLKVNFSPKIVFSVEHSTSRLSFRPINYSQVIISSVSQTSLILGQPYFPRYYCKSLIFSVPLYLANLAFCSKR